MIILLYIINEHSRLALKRAARYARAQAAVGTVAPGARALARRHAGRTLEHQSRVFF